MVKLIYGSPCSGKTTYIKQFMGDNDVVCDVDLIYQSISNRDSHDADLYVHEIALKLREQLLDIIRDRSMEFNDAYVVSIANNYKKLQEDIDRVNADMIVFVDTPYEICWERAIKERKKYFKYFVDEWFSTKEFNEREDLLNAEKSSTYFLKWKNY